MLIIYTGRIKDTIEEQIHKDDRMCTKPNRCGHITYLWPEVENTHPREQIRFAIGAIRKAQKDIDIVIATFSEYIALTVICAVRCGVLSPEDIVFNVVCKNHLDEPYIKTLRVTEKGKFDGTWPGGFFEYRHDLLFDDDFESIKNKYKEN